MKTVIINHQQIKISSIIKKNLGFSKKTELGDKNKNNYNIKNDENREVVIKIFTLSLQFYLFKISIENIDKLIKMKYKLGLPFLTCSQDFISKELIPAWDNGNNSTFDFHLSLLILHEKSFNSVDNYPFLPSPEIFETIDYNSKNSSNKSKKDVIRQLNQFNNQQYNNDKK